MRLGIVGFRGMVGSVLLDRMNQEGDFDHADTTFFSSSTHGGPAPLVKRGDDQIRDAYDLDLLKKMDVIITCQGSDYTKQIYGKLRSSGFAGFWIDASSAMRKSDESVLVLDPVNLSLIESSIKAQRKDFIGANCTVSLMLMAINGLFKSDLIEWISFMSYQAASGAGAKNIEELLEQTSFLSRVYNSKRPAVDILAIEKSVMAHVHDADFPQNNFGHPLAFNLLPWIDGEHESGQSIEERKSMDEANRILNRKNPVAIDGTCVRVASLRCHAQGLTIKLKHDIAVSEIESLIANDNQWVTLVANNKCDTLSALTPQAVAGTLNIAVGRIRKMSIGKNFLNVFTVGDQLLWGAAEPLRRVFRIICESR